MGEIRQMQVEGMTCSNCALGVSRYLEKQGLENVHVDFTSGEVTYTAAGDPDMVSLSQGISKLGYKLIEDTTGSTSAGTSTGWSGLDKKLLISAVFTFPLLLHMFIDSAILHDPLFQFLLALPVYIIGMYHFARSAIASMKTGVPNMDVLITIGSSAAFIYSLTGWYMHAGTEDVSQFLFFETSATIITLVLLGNFIEKRTVTGATSSIRELASMQPMLAVKIDINKDQEEVFEEVDIRTVKSGDALLVNSGTQVPADGKVYFGSAVIDESMMTGESLPVNKKPGDFVYAGTVISDGSIKMVAEKTGSTTALSNIIDLVKKTASTKPPIQKLGDRISAVFVPAVLIIALGTFLLNLYLLDTGVTDALLRSVAVLVISCPCAMGLAAPTAVAAGIGTAARNGVLIKGGDTLESFKDIRVAVFDKTGTLTTGKFEVSQLKCYGVDEQEAINLLVSLEQHSTHPIARSILEQYSPLATTFISFESVDEKKGAGMIAEDGQGNRFELGSYAHLSGLNPEEGFQVYLASNGKIIAALEMADSIRSGSAELISSLKEMNITPILLSGDSEKRCRAVADALGIDEVYSSMLPDEKSTVIETLKKKGKILMVGDGINDAPSLVQADIGLSFADATKVAIDSASVILLRPDEISLVLGAIRIGKRTYSTIRQNFFWAFFYNVVAIPVAAFGFLSPMVAALSMAFSDVIVIGNSIRLNFFRIHGNRK